ncbi:MAG: SET domain-containing protein-lysine N-methyltransferase [Planctomycetota bacterium]|jgi:D-alanine-D-alanine ligase
MKVCLLTPQKLDVDPFPENDWPCDPRPFLPDADWTVATLGKIAAVRRVVAFARKGYDLFFNLCDGSWDEGEPGIEVVQTLERLDVPFTGATSEFYEPSRESMKRVCRAWGIDTPAYVIATTEDDLERAADTLRFPMIAKHPSSYASIGLTRDSRVETAEDLFKQARIMMRAYGGCLIEEFIEGTECTVLVAENPKDPHAPTTYTPMQYRFPRGETFKHDDMKWVDYRDMKCVPVTNRRLAKRVRDDSARLFVGLNGASYGRCDIRVDADGRAYMLEINSNCGLYYEPEDGGGADLALLADRRGHAGFTRQIVEAAFRRHERRRRGWEARPRPDGSYGVFATRPIRGRETIIALEEQPHELVTRAHVRRNWSPEQKERFARTAWPITDELWVMWSQDASEWKPVKHSCDPNAWLRGLDVVARRRIAAGDEITMDYATFRNERMPSFPCTCGSESCRGTIRGRDYLADFVEDYGPHVSDYVRRKRAERVTAQR